MTNLTCPTHAFALSFALVTAYAAAPARADTPAPLLDRALFVAEPEITAAQVSPTGTLLAFLRLFHGVETVWVKRTDEPLTTARPVIGETGQPVNAFYWSNDGRYLLFTTASSGTRRADLFAVRAGDISAPGDAPTARNLTARVGSPGAILAVPSSTPNVVYVALNDGPPPQQGLYALDIATGKPTLLRRNDLGAIGWVFDLSGKPRLAIRTGKYGQFEMMRLDAVGPKLVYTCTWSETCKVLQFDPDGWPLGPRTR